MKFVIVITCTAVLWGGLSQEALAATADASATTDASATDDPCHHTLPNHALIRHPSGEVYLNGQLIATYPDAACAAYLANPTADGGTIAPPNQSTHDGCGTFGASCAGDSSCCNYKDLPGLQCNWYSMYCYDSMWANRIYGDACTSCEPGLQSPAEYNQFVQYITAPSLPTDTSVNYHVFFNSLISGGTDNTILQPEILYYPKTNGSSAVWTLRAEAIYNDVGGTEGFDEKVGGNLDFPVAEGDVVVLAVNMVAGGGGAGQTTRWQIYAYDATSNLTAELYEELSGWGPFNQAYDVFEIHAIDACNALPSENQLAFNMEGLSQSSSSNPLYPVEVDHVQSWTGTHINNSSYTPNCSWGDSPASTGGSPNTLTWVH